MNREEEFPIVLIAPFNIDLGVRYISSFLKTKGYPVYIILFNQMRFIAEFFNNDYFSGPLLKHQICPSKDLDLLMALLKQLNPKLIGISVTSTAMRTAQMITSEIKSNLDAPVVWGGIHAIIAPEECIQYSDIVCLGEGEMPMWELAENIRNEKQAAGIKGLWIKNSSSIEENEPRPLIEDLDTLPFPDFVEENNKFLIDSGKIVKNPPIISAYEKNAYLIMSSRGCLFNCSYCCNTVIRQRYKGDVPYLRRRSVENVISELKLVIRNKPVRRIYFWDDVFTYDKSWIEEFCGRYLTEIGLPFFCYAHPKHTDRETLAKLAQSGLTYLSVGIQSGSEVVAQNIFDRVQSNREILDFNRKIKELRIPVRYDLITDNPYETELDQDNAVELLLQLGVDYGISIYSLCYFPQTPLTKRVLDEKIITKDDLEQYSSKALNNFNLFIQLSKNKTHFFWNCIKAMAVNKFFPRRLVRVCKKLSLFRNHPCLLFFLNRWYLRIYKLFIYNYALHFKICLGLSDFLFTKPKLIFSLFPLKNTENEKRYCVKIGNKINKNIPLQFICELLPTSAERNKNITRWAKMAVELKANSYSSFCLDLKYPDLYCFFDGVKSKIGLLQKGNFNLRAGEVFFFRVKCLVPGKLLPKKFLYLGDIICRI